MSDWVKIRHPEFDGVARIPAAEHVIEHYQELGWEVDDSPEEREVFIPPRDPQPSEVDHVETAARTSKDKSTSAVDDGTTSKE